MKLFEWITVCMKIILICWLNLWIFFLKHAHLLTIETKGTSKHPHTNSMVITFQPIKLQTISLILYNSNFMQQIYVRKTRGFIKINICTVNGSLLHHQQIFSNFFKKNLLLWHFSKVQFMGSLLINKANSYKLIWEYYMI